MQTRDNRLYFIDAMRAWAIVMMLQGHFVDGLLDPVFRNAESGAYGVWKYFRGITAPVFFTVSGFIFTYLLLRPGAKGLKNPRVKRGIKRGLELLLIGYLLRINLFGLLKGSIYPSFFVVDVLHIIGLSLLGIIALYLLTIKLPSWGFTMALLGTTLLLFTLEPWYKTLDYGLLPHWIANYFTKANGSVFTLVPWLGYAAFGAFLSKVFRSQKDHPRLYALGIPLCLGLGAALIGWSSGIFLLLHDTLNLPLFNAVAHNNYLYMRLGDVLLVFALFMFLRQGLRNPTLIKLGQSTLSIYVIHFIVLYGSFTGLGLYHYFHHQLGVWTTILGALGFTFGCCLLALAYENNKVRLKMGARSAWGWSKRNAKAHFPKMSRLFGTAKN
ncbi:acyltransferase family protein [Maribacter sp. 2307ULW6-5]|uniref:acyltransferase family protein n=1 Tax=Maribacter sp. 2307ULW6-5 TaxID=3386275 RepID=UPI0039BCAB84